MGLGYYARQTAMFKMPLRSPLLLCLAVVSAFIPAALRSQGQASPQVPKTEGKTEVKTNPKLAAVQIPMSRLKPDAVFDVPGVPDWQAVDEMVWVSNGPKNSITSMDPATNKVAATIPVGKRPCSGLAAGFGSIWVPNCGDQTVSRVDIKTGTVVATIATGVGNSEGGIATGAGSVWLVVDKIGTLVRIDPATNKAVAEIALAPGSYGMAFGEEALWVTSTEKDLVTRIDPQTNVIVETIPVGKGPRFITVGEGGVWTLNQGDGTISRIDPRSNKVVATIEAGLVGPGGEISAGEGSVWATLFGFPITRVDPATNTVAQQFVGEGGDAIRVGHGSIWLSNLKQQNLWRLDPKRIEATVPQ